MLIRDLVYAIRSFRGRPGVAAIAILSLALGLGAAASAVSLLDGFGMRAPAVDDPGGLVRIRSILRAQSRGRLSYPDFEDIRSRAHGFSALTAYSIRGAGVSSPEGPAEVVLIDAVSPGYFETIGVRAAVGRTLGALDGAANAPCAAMLSHRLWQRRFAGDPRIVQRSIQIDGADCAVAGVLPRGFTGLDPITSPDVWIPLTAWASLIPGSPSELASRDSRVLDVVGRLRAPLSWLDRFRDRIGAVPAPIARGQKEVDAIVAEMRVAHPETNRDERFAVIGPSQAGGRGLMFAALLLWMLIALVVLVGCANVAGLLLGRAEERRREMAIRVALGARPRRLVAQLLTEALALALASIAAGLLIAGWIIRALPALLPPMALPFGFEFRLDLRVATATAAIGAATVLVFGLWPAVRASREAIAEAARGACVQGAHRGRSARDVMVVAQIAVSFVLLATGALLALSVRNSGRIDPGFEVRPLLLASVSPVAAGYSGARSRAFFETLLERAAAAPGVEGVTLARRVPLDPNGGGATRDVLIPGQSAPSDGEPLHIKYTSVAPGYFELMGTRITRGRAFNVHDGPRDAKVVVVNEGMAKRYWPDRPAIGERIRVVGPGAADYEIVGVAQDGKINRLTEAPEPCLFFVFAQMPASQATLIVKAGGDPRRAAPTIRDVVRGIDERIPTLQMITLAEHVRYATYEDRLMATIVASLSGLGLVLTLGGLFGVVSFTVASRTREIGIRMALGARPAVILREVMRRAVVLTATGVAVGAAVALTTSQALATSLYGVSASDLRVFGGTAAGLLAVAMLASWLPARRAMHVDPIDVLRQDA